MNTDKMLVKVCGMRDADNIREVSQLGVDMIGFIFYPKSPRFVQMISSKAGIIPDYSEERIELAMARKTAETQKQPARVGVFVDDMPQNIVTRVYNYRLDYIQLHGNEPRETIENLRATIDPDIKPNIRIIKAISVSSAEDIQKYKGMQALLTSSFSTPNVRRSVEVVSSLIGKFCSSTMARPHSS